MAVTTSFTVPDVYYAVMGGYRFAAHHAEFPATLAVKALRIIEPRYYEVDQFIRDRFDTLAGRDDVYALLTGTPSPESEQTARVVTPRSRLTDTAEVTFDPKRPKGRQASRPSWYAAKPADWEALAYGIRHEWSRGHELRRTDALARANDEAAFAAGASSITDGRSGRTVPVFGLDMARAMSQPDDGSDPFRGLVKE